MKIASLPTLWRSVLAAVCVAAAAALPASAQPPAAGSTEPVLSDAVLGVLGLEKSQVEPAESADQAVKDKIKKVRTALENGLKAFTQQRNADQAMTEFGAARKEDPSLPPPSLLLARLCFATNDQQIINIGRGLLERTIVTDAKSPEAYVLFGRLALAEGRLTDAALNFDKALSLVADPMNLDAGAPAGSPAEAWTKERRAAFLKEIYAGHLSVTEQRAAGLTGKEQQDAWNAAVAEVDTWLALDPNDAVAHFRKGRILYMKDPKDASQRTAARKEFEDAYKFAKDDPKRKKDELIAVLPPGLAMLQLDGANGNLESAKKEVESLAKDAEKLYSDDAKEQSRIYTNLSQWYLQQNEPVKAQEMANKAKELDSASPALKQLAAVMRYYANDPQARKEFEEMNLAAPDDFLPANFLALILCESDVEADKNKAVRLAELNVRLNPRSPEAISTLGWVYHKVGRTPEALQVYNALVEAIQKGGGGQINADTAYYMASVLARTQGQMDNVIGLLRNAVGSSGAFKHRADAENWLKSLTGETAPKGGSTSLVPPTTPAPATTGTGTTPAPAGGTTTPAKPSGDK